MNMRKIEINVPKGTKYLNEMDGFELPNGILNKSVPNCGATTLALTDKHKTIIASPRVNLLVNKQEQTKGTLLVKGGVSKDSIMKYINATEVPKILVTYDSIAKVMDCIDDKTNWRVVIDEFQYIIADGSFKSETEMGLLEKIKVMPYVTYLSATPCLDELLEQIENFQEMDYYQLIWEDVEKVKVIRQRSHTPIKVACKIVKDYKKGIYPSIKIKDETVFSKECVIFVNSVNNILSVINNAGLKPDEVNIIVGNPKKNESDIKTLLGEGFEIGHIPLKGEKHKKFTFCTSTAFAGCDFYSTCASTFVISDCHRTNTTIDISTDLVQIAGRQRLECNPFRKHITFVYNFQENETEDYKENLKKKCEQSKDLINYCNQASEDISKRLKSQFMKSQCYLKYSESYAMCKDIDHPMEFNYIAYISEKYECVIKAHQYRDGITVKSCLEDEGFGLMGNQEYVEYEEQLEYLSTELSFNKRMERYCNAQDNKKGMLLSLIDIEHPEIKYYYEQLGSKRIEALGYKECELKKEIAVKQKEGMVCYELEGRIKDIMPISEIRAMLSDIYAKLGINKAAKATDLRNLYGYDIKEDKMRMEDGSRKNIYKIKKVK
jgi:hypothetical protein